MDRSRAQFTTCLLGALLSATLLVTASGCPALLATGIYVIQGGNTAPANFDGLAGQRVVVICQPPSSHEFRHAGAARSISHRVSELLVENVKKIDVVNPREVDNWVDEEDWGDFKELAEAVKADMVLHVELEDFDLEKGKTLYQGRADIKIAVYDMREKGKQVWSTPMGEVLYPVNSGIPAQDKPVQLFEREFVEVVSEKIAINFYKHDPTASYALDAKANR